MSLVRNLGPVTRVGFVLCGAALIVAAFWAPALSVALALLAGAVGLIVVVEGAVGF